ncbi:MAG: DUF4836 family protein [Chitinophagia bacterium]|jgi:hypothetical protein
MKNTIILWLLIGSLLIFSSCSNKAPKEAAYIPKTASFVITLDLTQLQQKLNEGGYTSDTLIAMFAGKDSAAEKIKKLLQAARKESGINWNEKLFIFVNQKDFPDKSSSTSINIMTSTDNENAVGKYLLEQEELQNKKIKEEKNYSYIQDEKEWQVSWNKEICMLTYFMHETQPTYDSIEMTFKEAKPANLPKECKEEVDRFFTQSTNQSLASVEVFNDMFREKADGFIFSSSNSSLPMLRKLPFNPPKLEELLKDNYTTATIHFEKGKIRVQSNNYTNPVLNNLLGKYAGPVVNFSLVNNYPSQQINLVTMASFNPEIIGGILKHLDLEVFANSYLEKNGLQMKDVYKAFKGEISVVVSDIQYSKPDPMKKRDELSMERGLPQGKYMVTIPVGDITSYHKIMDMAVSGGWIAKTGAQYHSTSLVAGSFYFLGNDKQIVIASDSSLYNQSLANKGKKNPLFAKEPISKYNASSILFYMDIASTIHGLIPDSTNTKFNKLLYQIGSSCKEVVLSTGNFDGKTTASQAELSMQNNNVNSLVSIVQLLTLVADEYKENKQTSEWTGANPFNKSTKE